VTFVLSTEAWALMERALEGARRESESSLSDGEAFEAVARDALLVQTKDIEASDPRRAVVLYECTRCSHAELDTGAGTLELAPASAAALGCGAEQAHGGEHSRRNCLVLCTTHHRLLHEGKLSIEGDAERELCFRDATGEELGRSHGPSRAGHELSSSTESAEETGASSPETTGRATTHLGTSNEVEGTPLEDRPHPNPEGKTAPERPTIQQRTLSHTAASVGLPAEPAARLLQIMGRRGGWSPDALIEASGLSASQVAVALTLLELARLIRRRDFLLEPV